MTTTVCSCKATTQSFTGPKKGRYTDVDIVVLHDIKDADVKGL
jgi:hypothetical protein